jgi:hypothetical protein
LTRFHFDEKYPEKSRRPEGGAMKKEGSEEGMKPKFSTYKGGYQGSKL